MTLVSPLDAPILLILGVVSGLAYRRRLYRRNKDWFVFLGVCLVGAFWLMLLLANVTSFHLWKFLPVVETESVLLSIFYPLAYPFWFWIGGWVVFLLLGRRPDQGGIYWLYRIEDETEDFDPSWDS